MDDTLRIEFGLTTEVSYPHHPNGHTVAFARLCRPGFAPLRFWVGTFGESCHTLVKLARDYAATRLNLRNVETVNVGTV